MAMTGKALELQALLEPTVSGLGLELRGIEFSPAAGNALLRLYIDAPGRLVGIEDCEAVSREVSANLDVNDPIASQYTLEVSSPGIDRPLKTEADLSRFCGEVIDITLKAPMGAAAAGLVSANRKKFRGVLEVTDTPQTWQITWRDEPVSKPGMRVAKVKKDLPVQALQFTLSELREARLAPIVDFKGRRPAEKRSN